MREEKEKHKVREEKKKFDNKRREKAKQRDTRTSNEVRP